MNPIILLAAIAGVPILLGLLFRVSAIFMFVAAAAGSVLVTYMADDAGLALGMWVRNADSNMFAQFGLLLLPVVLTLLFMRKTMPKSKLLLHLPVLIAIGGMLAVLALPLMDSNAQAKIFTEQYGEKLQETQDVIVGVAAAGTLLLMWLTERHKADKKEKKKHKKH